MILASRERKLFIIKKNQDGGRSSYCISQCSIYIACLSQMKYCGKQIKFNDSSCNKMEVTGNLKTHNCDRPRVEFKNVICYSLHYRNIILKKTNQIWGVSLQYNGSYWKQKISIRRPAAVLDILICNI